MRLLLCVALMLSTSSGYGADEIAQCGERAPRLSMPHAPRRPVVFARTVGRDRESLQVRYISPGTMKFNFDKKGRCSRHETGIAKIKPCWWLGAETDENEAGEAIAVTEYVFDKNRACSMTFRIDEGGWTRSTVTESAACSAGCPSSGEVLLGQSH